MGDLGEKIAFVVAVVIVIKEEVFDDSSYSSDKLVTKI